MNQFQAQFERCCGPAMKPRTAPRLQTGIDRELEERAEIDRYLGTLESELKGER